jgi:hypothetical protein
MTASLRLLLIGGTALSCFAIAHVASAQPLPPQPPPGPVAAPPPPPDGATFSQQQLPETRGTVQRFTLTPRGDLDGFVLADGTDVHVPPHLSTQLAAAVRPGDAVSVRGYRSGTVPLVVAAAVTDAVTNQTVVDQGPPPPGFGPPPPPPPGVPTPGSQQISLIGKVQASLYGPAGDLNGAVLDDGTIVRLPPPTAYQSSNLLAPGQSIAVQGWGLTNAYGRVVDAQAIGPAAAQMTSVAPPPSSGASAPPAPAIAPASPPQPPGR